MKKRDSIQPDKVKKIMVFIPLNIPEEMFLFSL